MKKRSKIGTLCVVVFAIAIIFSTMMLFPGDHRKWTVLATNESVPDPAAGENSGICGFYVFVKGSTYTSNLTEGGGYFAGGTQVNATNLDIPHSTKFDLIVWARFNDTDSGLDIQFTRCNMTWTTNISSSDAPDHIHITGQNATMMWVNFVWDNSDVGFEINRNQKDIAIDDIIIKGYK